ncbi:hypothetical protein Dda_1897 [Drechslerella dactyloides]|uniref:HMG box domain-containing protein n=1 Tax=Drechslerella dactyloides TaxID=74499 RepID=A0AAD6NLV1_DREDA|nr:hypothetical protein Dda_1897 [Drechslerella dactyloides]
MFFANEQRENVRAENPGIAFGKLLPVAPAVASGASERANERIDKLPRRRGATVCLLRLVSSRLVKSIGWLTDLLRAGQVGKVLGERWKALSDKQRAPYEAKAATDKKRYEDEKAQYQVSPGPSSPHPRRSSV